LGCLQGTVVLPVLGVLVTSKVYGCGPVGLVVTNLTTGTVIRTIGTMGLDNAVGTTAQLWWPLWPCAAPWSNTTVLVGTATSNVATDRYVEVDVVTGFLVKTWFTGLIQPYGIAATGSRIAVTHGGQSGNAWIRLFDLGGNPLWSVGGAELAYGTTTNVGVLLGRPTRVTFSQDGSYLLVAEANSQRVTKWSSATGAYLGSVGSGYTRPQEVVECWTGTGVGAIVVDGSNSKLSRVSEAGVVTTSSGVAADMTSLVLVPGQGAIAVSYSQGFYYLRSVAIATHPVTATVLVGAAATFSVTLTANSATTGLTYAWTKGGVAVGTNSASLSYTTSAADVGSPMSIVCTVTHAMGRAVSNTAKLTVVVRPFDVVVYWDRSCSMHPFSPHPSPSIAFVVLCVRCGVSSSVLRGRTPPTLVSASHVQWTLWAQSRGPTDAHQGALCCRLWRSGRTGSDAHPCSSQRPCGPTHVAMAM
jgi:hypothetical protein